MSQSESKKRRQESDDAAVSESDSEESEEGERMWHGDFDKYLDVNATLMLKPTNQILKKGKFKKSKPVITYKYQDSHKQIRFIIGGFSYSTYIRRLLIHLDSLTHMLDMVMGNYIMAGWDLEEHLFGNIQMTQDLFREDLLPLIAYTIVNKDSHKKEYKVLINKLLTVNKEIMKLALMNGDTVHFEEPRRFSIFSNETMENIVYVTERFHDKEVRDTENITLFITSTMFNIFVSTNHYKVLLKMLEYFVEILSVKIAASVKVQLDDFETQNND